MSKSAASSSWVGAPPLAEEGFAYSEGGFLAEASGQNRHPRASKHELDTHFTTGNASDHPAHWFEAQLIHYGLNVSKNKAVARTRLLDAFNSGSLEVPPHVARLEADMKKRWTKMDREAKKGLPSAGVKRNREPSPEPASKKAKPSPAAKKPTPKAAEKKTASGRATPKTTEKKTAPKKATPKAAEKKAAPKPTEKKTAPKTTVKQEPSSAVNKPVPAPPVKKQTARCVRGGSSQGPGRGVVKQEASPSPQPPRTKQTARCTGRAGRSQGPGREAAKPEASPSPQPPRKRQTARCTGRGGLGQSPGRGAAEPEASPSPQPPRQKQTARRSGAFMARERIPPPIEHHWDDNSDGYDSGSIDNEGDHHMRDDPPPPYRESDGDGLKPLGILNGEYNVESEYVESQWRSLEYDFSMTLTIAGRQLWGQFELGIIAGVIYFPERPWRSSEEPVEFLWRGEEQHGPIQFGDNNRGWMRFLGGGRIKGCFETHGLDFTADWIPMHGTRSPVEVATLKQQWDGFSEERYERERRGRWGGGW
ncbi:hypothetical protein CDD80_4356 [Ophiocordyceps camponoti-rufipedis]|uniref:Uncharacterized protein n=1 Tax=Ophiocordyceps camponoti-rufipedis TaxID=2004952 RepID=A0A2C5ZJJ7_9HYPO|nr:hypothetical protein CDD80_4356 [Ophiocordyceps camponoti-rufipedis]